MTKDTSTSLSNLDLLDLTLDTYGSDRTRWPAQRRRELSQFVSTSPLAQQKLAEAIQFDRLLDTAPTLSADRQAHLVDEIMRRVEYTPRIVAQTTSVPASRTRTRRRWSPIGAAGAALAASLLLGIVAGQNGTFGTAVDDLAAAAGLDSGASQQVAQTDESGNTFDEDLL